MIRQAQENDLPRVMAIINETVAIMAAEGNDQWDTTYPTIEIFAQDIIRQALYVFCDDDGGVQGVACFDNEPHPAYAPLPWQIDERALIIHRLAVAPTARGQGIGTALMRFAEELAHMQGLQQIRTDTYHCNTKMQALFQKMGYHPVGTCRFIEELGDFYCYEKVWA